MPNPLDAVDTIVIVMLENRSFDHVLGFLSHEAFDGRRDVNGLHERSAEFAWDNYDDDGTPHPPTATADSYLPYDMPHGRAEVANQIAGGSMLGFVTSYFGFQPVDRSPVPMRFCRPNDIPITAMLARNYMVCDRWHASLPDDTFPNRLMSLSGYTRIDDTGVIMPTKGKLIPDQSTVFDWLGNKGLDYRIYVDARPVIDVGPPASMLLMQNQWGNVLRHAHVLDHLAADWNSSARAPDVIYCEPFFNDFAIALTMHGNCNHPPLPISYGEELLRQVYTTLASHPEKWARTMMVICYDEHGGFFDHVEPPAMQYKKPPDHIWKDASDFQTLGVRVPGIIVSPLVERGSVYPHLLDHTSILQLMVDKFGTRDDFAYFGDTPNRKAAGVTSLASTLQRADARTDDVVDLPPAPHYAGAAITPPVSNVGQLFLRMKDMAPKRVLGLL